MEYVDLCTKIMTKIMTKFRTEYVHNLCTHLIYVHVLDRINSKMYIIYVQTSKMDLKFSHLVIRDYVHNLICIVHIENQPNIS